MVRPILSAALVLAVAAATLGQQQAPRLTERVEVRRILVDVHVVDTSGAPIQGLTAADFVVRVDGKPARVEHARFIVSGHEGHPTSTNTQGATAASPGAERATTDTTRTPDTRWTEVSGRLIVLIFQRSMEPSRLGGLLQMQAKAARFIETLAASDRVALVWFDSHLKLGADFTADRDALASAVRRSAAWTTPEELPPGPSPSLAALFDYRAAADAASIEQGLLVLARALEQLPGPKVAILFGWGFGRGSHARNDDDYSTARAALVSARTSVFSVDVTDAAAHTLEAGLQALSSDTGGDYVRTVDFSDAAFDRVARIVSAQYELSVEPPQLPRGRHTIEVDVPKRHATVFARKGYSD